MAYKPPSDFKELHGLIDTAPVRLTPIVDKLGLQVYLVEMKDGVSGKLLANKHLPKSLNGGKCGWTIFANANEPARRVRFTVAHEIGHFLLHKDIATQYGRIVDDSLYRSEQISDFKESEANRFAADLLMPWDEINRYIESTSSESIDVEQMADYFDVSKIAMAIRLGVDA